MFYMNFKEEIIKELDNTPDFLLEEVINFIQFLKYKHLSQKNSQTALLSESSLQKDWLTSEEDKAWQHL